MQWSLSLADSERREIPQGVGVEQVIALYLISGGSIIAVLVAMALGGRGK